MNVRTKFAAFHAQNIAAVKRLTAAAPAHPINQGALDAWHYTMIQRLGPNWPAASDFVQRFRAGLRSISMGEFRERFTAVLRDVLLYVKRENPDDVVLTFMDVGMKKSGLWLAMLAWDVIGFAVTRVMDVLDIPAFTTKYSDRAVLVVYLDDCAYSGLQAYTHFIKQFDDEASKNVVFGMAIPYMTWDARTRLTESPQSRGKRFWFSTHTEVLPLLYGRSGSETGARILLSGDTATTPHVLFWSYIVGDMDIAKDARGRTVYLIPNHAAVYFDHKLADTFSTYTDLISLGTTVPAAGDYNVDTIELNTGFIKGCEQKSYGTHAVGIDHMSAGDVQQCPNPLYKTIEYMWNSAPPEADDTEGGVLFYLKTNSEVPWLHICRTCCSYDVKWKLEGVGLFCSKQCASH